MNHIHASRFACLLSELSVLLLLMVFLATSENHRVHPAWSLNFSMM